MAGAYYTSPIQPRGGGAVHQGQAGGSSPGTINMNATAGGATAPPAQGMNYYKGGSAQSPAGNATHVSVRQRSGAPPAQAATTKRFAAQPAAAGAGRTLVIDDED